MCTWSTTAIECRVVPSAQSKKIAPVYSRADLREELPRNTIDSRVDPASPAKKNPA
jgi:hypothetical protein